jgi:hypothetical protein
MDSRSLFITTIQQELCEIETRLQEAKTLLDSQSDQRNNPYRRGYEDTQARLKEILGHMETVENAEEHVWEELQLTLHNRMENLRIAAERLPRKASA